MQRGEKEYTGIYWEKVLNFAGFQYKLSLKSIGTKQYVYLVDINLLYHSNCWEQNDVS